MTSRILHVDDRSDTRLTFAGLLSGSEYTIEHVDDCPMAVQTLRRRSAALVLANACLNHDMSGLQLLKVVRTECPAMPVIIYSDSARVREVVSAIKAGATDYVQVPIGRDDLLRIIREATQECTDDSPHPSQAYPFARRPNLVAISDAMRHVVSWANRIGPTHVPVLLMGETGTGKDLLAGYLHSLGGQLNRPFISINCCEIPPGLLEAELFGHLRGSYTDAHSDRRGLIEEAHRGTLFLDEIGEIVPDVQTRLLGFLDRHVVRRLGDTRTRRIETRVIAATNRDLAQEVASGRFRLDLYHRLRVASCTIPPLRMRLDDLDALTDFWLSKLCAELGRTVAGVTASARLLLRAHSWPGNVRELINVLRHAIVMADGPEVTEADVSAVLDRPGRRSEIASGTLDREADQMLAVLEDCHWKMGHAAAALGVSRTTLWRRLRRRGIRALRRFECKS